MRIYRLPSIELRGVLSGLSCFVRCSGPFHLFSFVVLKLLSYVRSSLIMIVVRRQVEIKTVVSGASTTVDTHSLRYDVTRSTASSNYVNDCLDANGFSLKQDAASYICFRLVRHAGHPWCSLSCREEYPVLYITIYTRSIDSCQKLSRKYSHKIDIACRPEDVRVLSDLLSSTPSMTSP